MWLATGMNGPLGFRLRQGYAGQVAGFRKDAPRLAAGCFTSQGQPLNIKFNI